MENVHAKDSLYRIFLDRSLMIGREIPETLKGCPLYSLSCVSVCVFVCSCVRGLESTPFDLGTYFWVQWSLGHEEKTSFFSRNFHFYVFYLHFSIFSLYIFFCFELPVTVFHLEMSYLGWENFVPLEIEDFFRKFNFLRLKG